MEFTVLGDRPERKRERGEGRLSWWRGQERVTCPRHLQFFFPCLAPARCPRSQSVTTDRPVPRNGAKISLKLIERGCYDFLGTGGAHTIAVSWINYRLTYVRTAIFFFFSAPPAKKRDTGKGKLNSLETARHHNLSSQSFVFSIYSCDPA